MSSLPALAPTWPMLAMLCGLTLSTATARAEPESTPSAPGPRQFGLALRGFESSGGLLPGLGGGLELEYAPIPYLALGALADSLGFDQGDPEGCDLCVGSATILAGFAEGRALPTALTTPYARVGLGRATLHSAYQGPTEATLAVTLEAGLDLHLGLGRGRSEFSLRGFIADRTFPGTKLIDSKNGTEQHHFFGPGLALGLRF